MDQSSKASETFLAIISIAVIAFCLNLISAPCALALDINETISHDCPQCPPADEDDCHDEVECNNCDRDFLAYECTSGEKVYNSSKDNSFAIELVDFLHQTRFSHISPTTIFTSYSSELPLFIQYCSFLN